jgi:hypothetical protein
MTINTNPLSYNQYIQTLAGMAVYGSAETGGVWAFTDAPPQLQVPMILNYAELRIQRDLDMLPAQSSNVYTLTPANYIFQLPVDDFIIVQRVSIVILNGTTTVSVSPLTQVSQEFIQNVYGGLNTQGQPEYYAMIGDVFGGNEDTYNQIALGPTPNFAYSMRIHGLTRMPSMYKYATSGPADTSYTYISAYYPDMLIMASMIYISAFQRNFSATSDDTQMGMTYEKQYQILRLAAIDEENRKKSQGSAWSSYSTPTSATPTR